MIYDKLSDAKLYYKFFPQLSIAVKFIRNFNTYIKDGKYPIKGEDIFALISSYDTKIDDNIPFEAHKKYIDLQYLISGKERLDITHKNDLKIKTSYSQKKDILFVHPPKNYSSIILSPGKFCLLFPQDYHRPGQSIKSITKVRKIVIKISAA